MWKIMMSEKKLINTFRFTLNIYTIQKFEVKVFFFFKKLYSASMHSIY